MTLGNPLLNRAIMGTYPPGSTFKTTQALTFFAGRYHCSGYDVSVCERIFVPWASCRLPCPSFAFILGAGDSYFVQRLFLLGLVSHDWGQRQKYGTVQKAMNTWRDYMVSMGFGYTLV